MAIDDLFQSAHCSMMVVYCGSMAVTHCKTNHIRDILCDIYHQENGVSEFCPEIVKESKFYYKYVTLKWGNDEQPPVDAGNTIQTTT